MVFVHRRWFVLLDFENVYNFYLLRLIITLNHINSVTKTPINEVMRSFIQHHTWLEYLSLWFKINWCIWFYFEFTYIFLCWPVSNFFLCFWDLFKHVIQSRKSLKAERIQTVFLRSFYDIVVTENRNRSKTIETFDLDTDNP